MVGHSSVDPRLGAAELALRPWAPAASVFKVVSATALVGGGVSRADTRTCYHGGVSSILARQPGRSPAPRPPCDTLAFGIGKSQNAIIAKLASRHLTADGLARVGHASDSTRPSPSICPSSPPTSTSPRTASEFARTAAGFWHSTLSPLHGALLAATIANRGEMPSPD